MPESNTKKYRVADPSSRTFVPAGRLRRRRSIIGNALRAVGGAVCASPLVAGCGAESPSNASGEGEMPDVLLPSMVGGKMSLRLEDYPALKDVGGAIQGTAEGIGAVFIVHEEEGKFVAANATCTHMACPLRYNGLNHTFDCQCHGSTFETDGTVVTGPATKTLPTYVVDFDGKSLTVRLR